MKTALLSTYILLFTGLMNAQITISQDFFPSAGDSLFTATDNMPANIAVGNTGGPFNWNFSGLQAPFTVTTVFKAAAGAVNFNSYQDADLFVDLGNNGEAFYHKSDTRFELIGYFGADPIGLGIDLLARYSPALLERFAPISFISDQDSHAALTLPFATADLPGNILDSLMVPVDSLRILLDIQRSELADAYGTMTIPGGGPYDVLRVKRTDIREIKLEALLPVLNIWIDVTNQLPPNPLLDQTEEKSYRFLNDQSKEPIAVAYVDPANDQVQRVEYKVVTTPTTGTKKVDLSAATIYAYPNPAIEEVRFDFTNLKSDFYKLRIYNILGVAVWENTYWIPNNHTEKVNLSKLRKGTYLYSLVDSRGKTIITKRLMIVRP